MKIFTTQERTVVIILASLFMLGMAVKVTKEHYNTGTDQITLIGSSADIVNFYAGLDEDDIESAGKVDINSAGIDELKSLPGISNKTFEKLLSYIQIN